MGVVRTLSRDLDCVADAHGLAVRVRLLGIDTDARIVVVFQVRHWECGKHSFVIKLREHKRDVVVL